jgi:hypothetical protein
VETVTQFSSIYKNKKNRLEQINELIYIQEKGIIIYIQNTTNPLFRVQEQYNFRAI